ncbi:alpha-amylase family glycosyl hydrolase [Mycoplasma sp. M5725]|uniref:Alpha-amylase family glycosyl hydrolase n=1 Tax=Mycoplasma phocimorsus TaxID=3045839 RepID=A0AAJ1PSV0_9MOLU|nr:alpha-amylase family glycosyl hydrolase [Mycoplasma phocimorsus]MDJ1645911.1 alpha-amylase family glycosyl hydrolase [Mycoplasma phocimorsus]
MLLDTSHDKFWFNEGDPNPHYSKPNYWLERFERVAYDELEIELRGDNANSNNNGDKLQIFNALDKYNSLVPIDKKYYKVTKQELQENGKNKRVLFKVKLSKEYLKKPSKHYDKIDLGDVFTASYDNENLGAATYARRLFEGDEYTYDTDYMWYWTPDLGANMISSTEVEVKLWAPASKTVHIQLYDKNNHNQKVGKPIALTQGDKKNERIWSTKIHTQMPELYWEFPYFASLDGYYYEYILNMNTKYEKIVLDPYAKSMAAHKPGEVGKGAFVDMNSSRAGIYNLSKSQGIFSGGLEGKLNKMIGYEVHVRDYTISRDDVSYKGTFKGMTNWDAGIEYLKDLGITHVQFLPLQNYSSVDETSQSWTNGDGTHTTDGQKTDKNPEGDVYTRTKAPNYNWGYDPHNYFTIEGWLSSDPKDPYSRISELRTLIKKLHDNGIGVIADVVYNHMAENWFLDNIVPNHYFRRPGGPTPVGGPALASENKMARKIIIESAKWLVDQYGVDGFRFDLMGFIDKETIRLIKDKVKTPDGHDLIMYGESWDFSDLPKEQRLVKGETKALEGGVPGVGYFNDTIRDTIKGQVGDHEGTKLGWVHQTDLDNGWKATRDIRAALLAGISRHAQKAKNGSNEEMGENYADILMQGNDPDNRWNKDGIKTNYINFTNEPNEAIQYQTIHDGYTLWDKLNIASPKKYTHEEEKSKNKNKNGYDPTIEQKEIDYKIKLAKQSLGLMFAGQGRIVLQGGDEIGRTKPLSLGDANPDRAEGSTNAIRKEALPDILHKETGRARVIVDYKYHDNSYNASDWANSYKWKRFDKNFAGGAFVDLHKYVKDVIKLRKENYEFRFETAQEIVDNFRFIGGKNNNHNVEGEYKSESNLSSLFQDNKAKVIVFNIKNGKEKTQQEVEGNISNEKLKFKINDRNVNEKEFELNIDKKNINRDKTIYVNWLTLKDRENNLRNNNNVILLNNTKPYNQDNNADKVIQYRIQANANKNYSQFIVMSNPFDDAILINEQIDESWELLIGENGKPELITQEDKERGYVVGTPIAPAHSTVILGKRRKFKASKNTPEKVKESAINAFFSEKGTKLSFEDVNNNDNNQFEGKIDWNLPEGYTAQITKVEKKVKSDNTTSGVLITYNIQATNTSSRKKRSIDSQSIEKQLWIPEYLFKNKLTNLAENVEVKLNDKLLNLTWDEVKRRHLDFIKKNLIFTNIKEQKLFFNNLEVKIEDNQIRVNFDIYNDETYNRSNSHRVNRNISKMLFKNEAIYLDYLILNFDQEWGDWGLHVWEDGFKYAYRTTHASFTDNVKPSNNKEQSFGSLPEWNENNWKFKNKKIVFKNINIKQISEFVIHKNNNEKSFNGGNLKWPINDMLKKVNKGGVAIAEYWVKKDDYKVYADSNHTKAVN